MDLDFGFVIVFVILVSVASKKLLRTSCVSGMLQCEGEKRAA